MHTVINFLLLTLLSFTAMAQSSPKTLAGSVNDIKNEPVSGATVSLLKAFDSSTVKNSITASNGKFHFSGLQTGSYLLTVTATGQKRFSGLAFTVDDLHNSITLPVIILLPSKSIILSEITVTAKRALIEQDIDKTVVNVASMLSSATSNTLEVLEKTPGVTVTAAGDISLNGRSGVLVLIDGRATYMSEQDLAAYLKSLPGSLVDKIELIDNPSARYDASGNAIINIRLKKNRTSGYTGNVSLGYTQGKFGRNNDAISVNYNYRKLNLFANVGYNKENNYTEDMYDRRFYTAAGTPNSYVSLLNRQRNASRNLSENFGLDYAASPNTTYGFQLTLSQGKRNSDLDYTSKDYNANKQLDTVGKGITNATEKRRNIGTNFNYLHKFGKTGKEISADINYLRYNTPVISYCTIWFFLLMVCPQAVLNSYITRLRR